MSRERDENIIEVEVPMTKVVTVKLDYDLLQVIDRLWKTLGYSNRSEFIRDALSYYLAYLTGEGSYEVATTPENVGVSFDHSGSGPSLKEKLRLMRPNVKR